MYLYLNLCIFKFTFIYYLDVICDRIHLWVIGINHENCRSHKKLENSQSLRRQEQTSIRIFHSNAINIYS